MRFEVAEAGGGGALGATGAAVPGLAIELRVGQVRGRGGGTDRFKQLVWP